MLRVSCFHKQSWSAYENKLKTTYEHGTCQISAMADCGGKIFTTTMVHIPPSITMWTCHKFFP